MRDLDKTLGKANVNQQGYCCPSLMLARAMIQRIAFDLGIASDVESLGMVIAEKVIKLQRENARIHAIQFDNYFEVAACLVMAIKLIFGLNDQLAIKFKEFL